MLQLLAGPGASQIGRCFMRENLQVAGEFHPCFCFGQLGQRQSIPRTLLKTNSSHLKMVVSNRNLLFQGSIFRCYVSFRDGNYPMSSDVVFDERLSSLRLLHICSGSVEKRPPPPHRNELVFSGSATIVVEI